LQPGKQVPIIPTTTVGVFCWAGENHANFRIVTFKSDHTFIPYKFWILDFRIWI
jgi:hypothetical protein